MKNYYLYKEGFDGSELGKDLEYVLDDTADKISGELNRIFQKEIYHNWSRKDTWCYFFTDYPSNRKQWLIGTGDMVTAHHNFRNEALYFDAQYSSIMKFLREIKDSTTNDHSDSS